MTFYDQMAGVADELLSISEFGQLAAVRRVVKGVRSPTSVDASSDTVTDYPCLVALFPVSQRDIDGTHVKAGDWRALVATKDPAGTWDDGQALGVFSAITPTTTDRLICSEGDLKIVDAGKFAPAGQVTHYRMVVRR